jgi:succinate--hydroxymethylglutarate CoA-transferase
VKVLGREDLATEPRFAKLPDRVKNRVALYAILDAEVRKWPTAEIIAKLESAKVPCAPVNGMAQVFSHRQVQHRGMQQELKHPQYGAVPSLGSAIKFSSFDVHEGWSAPPLLGQDTDAVLAEWLGHERASA